jgi:hypothetical protein
VHLLRCFLLLPTAVFISAANGQDSISVAGKIIPPACIAAFVGGAHLDWGTVRWASLDATKMTTLEAKQVTLRVQCPEHEKAGMAFRVGADPNEASALSGPDTRTAGGAANHSEPGAIFGIGADPVTLEKLGNFTMTGIQSSHDGIASNLAYGIAADHSSRAAGFAPVSVERLLYREGREAVDWTAWDETVGKPALAAVYTFTFKIEPQLNSRSKLSATQEVPFSGAVQFNVRY